MQICKSDQDLLHEGSRVEVQLHQVRGARVLSLGLRLQDLGSVLGLLFGIFRILVSSLALFALHLDEQELKRYKWRFTVGGKTCGL